MEVETQLISGTLEGRADLPPPPASCAHEMPSFTPTNHLQDRFHSFTEFLLSNLSEWSRSHPPWPPAPPPISLSGPDVFIKGRLPHRTAAISLSLSSRISDETALSSALGNIVRCTQPSSKDANDRSCGHLAGVLGFDAMNCEMSQETFACSQSFIKDDMHGPSCDVNNTRHQMDSSLQGPSKKVVDTGTTLVFSNPRDKHDVEKTIFAHGKTSKEVKAVETPSRTQPNVCVASNEIPNQLVHALSSFTVLSVPAVASGCDSSAKTGGHGQESAQAGNGASLISGAEDQVNELSQLLPSMKDFSEKDYGSVLMNDYEEGELPEKLLDDEVQKRERDYPEATSCTAKVLKPAIDDGMNETIGCWLRRSSLQREQTVKHHSPQEADSKTFKRKSSNKKQKIDYQELVASPKVVANSDGALVIFGGLAGGEEVPLLEDGKYGEMEHTLCRCS